MKILKQNRMDKLLDEYMKRIQAGDTKAMNEIALIFQNSYQNKEAEKWFLKAIEAGDYEYANNLGYLYASQNDFENAKNPKKIGTSARIGVPNKGVWTEKKLRFFVEGNRFVSGMRKSDMKDDVWK